MIPIWIVIYGSIVIGLLLALWLRKISWKFLVYFLILSRIPDIISTVLCLQKAGYDYSAEASDIPCRMFLYINLPDVIVLYIHGILFVSFILLLSRSFWHRSEFSKFCIRLVILSVSIAGILISISNFAMYFFGEIF